MTGVRVRTQMSRAKRTIRRLYRIGEIVAHAPFSRQTIHNYTTMGLIRPARWSNGGQRLYDESVFERLANIATLKRVYPMRDVAKFLDRLRKVSGPKDTAPTKLYRIGEVSAQTSLPRQTIHRYTVMGLIYEAEWTDGGHRLYDESVFEKLKNIQHLRQKGHSLREIADITKGRCEERTSAKDSTKGLLRVGQVAREAGVSRQTIHRYTEMGLIREQSRTRGRQRLYDRVALERLKLILRLNDDGYPLRAINELFLRDVTR